jgi:hypothetical protein
MLLRINPNWKSTFEPATPAKDTGKLLRRGFAAGIVVFAALGATYELRSQQPTNPNRSILLPQVNRPPDANEQMAMHEQNAKKANFDAANLERKRQIADDSAKLLKLASDLKSEVDKTSKDTLSLGVIRKADEIEKLAHNVKEKMKLTMGGS